MAQSIGRATHLNANGAVLIRSGIGQLVSVTINRKGETGNALKLYDGIDAGGLMIADIDTTSALGSFLYDILLGAGLFVDLASGVAADVTITWS